MVEIEGFFVNQRIGRRTEILSINPENQKQCCFEQGWGFHEVSRTASMQDGDRKKFA